MYKRLLMVVQQSEHKRALKPLHDELEQCRIQATETLKTEIFWWVKVIINVAQYVKSHDKCQKMKAPEPYHSSLHVHQSSLFVVSFIDFGGLTSDFKK